ncbi:putative non-specific serine/threonine protein kinase [Microsporum ferrugineum]
MVTYIEGSTTGPLSNAKLQNSRLLKATNPASKPTKSVYGKKSAVTAPAISKDNGQAQREEISQKSASAPEDAESLINAVREQLSQITIEGNWSHTSAENRAHEPPEEGYDRGSDSLLPDKAITEDSTEGITSKSHLPERTSKGSNDLKEGAVKEEPTKQSRSRTEIKKRGDAKSQQTYVNDKEKTSYVQSILREGMSTRSSRGIQYFDKWANRVVGLFDVRKIAEGSYGEVYELCAKDGVSKASLSTGRASKLQAYMNGVFKIVPLRAQRGPGSKKFTTVDEIVAEVQLLKLLDPIPGFARFREIHVVQGRFPPSYQDAWNIYSQTKDDCFNPDPSKKKSYPDNQLWAILEMENAGFELEKFKFSSVFQVYDVFWGVALALARAEQYASFEHRDLHLGNVCVKQTQPPRETPQKRKYKKDHSLSACLGTSGLETTIIDYSLSRAELSSSVTPDTGFISGAVAWSDLERKEIFDAVGRDEDEKFLRDTYRLMRSEVFDDSCPSTEQWKNYRPRTNLIWLSFILTTLINKCHNEKLTPTQRQPLGLRPTNSNIIPGNLDARQKSMQGGKEGLKAEQLKLSEDVQQVLFERLETVQDLLELEDEYENLSCAGDLVAIAIGSQWLEESDFLC